MRFELPEAKKLTLEMVIPTRWGDMDAMGHDLLPLPRDRSYEWLHRVAGTPDPAGEGPVIVNTFCNFLRQLKYPGNVLAKHYVARLGRGSVEAYVTLERTDEPGVLYASGGEDGIGELSRGEVGTAAGGAQGACCVGIGMHPTP